MVMGASLNMEFLNIVLKIATFQQKVIVFSNVSIIYQVKITDNKI